MSGRRKLVLATGSILLLILTWLVWDFALDRVQAGQWSPAAVVVAALVLGTAMVFPAFTYATLRIGNNELS